MIRTRDKQTAGYGSIRRSMLQKQNDFSYEKPIKNSIIAVDLALNLAHALMS
jgi:hypothetical protein